MACHGYAAYGTSPPLSFFLPPCRNDALLCSLPVIGDPAVSAFKATSFIFLRLVPFVFLWLPSASKVISRRMKL